MAKGKKAKVFLTDRAISDLQDIEAYTIEKWGNVQAAKNLDAFHRLFGLGEAVPGILLPVPVIDQLIMHSVDSHVVVCTKWHDDVLVLMIVHSSRDLIPLLDRLLPTLKHEVEAMKKRLPENGNSLAAISAHLPMRPSKLSKPFQSSRIRQSRCFPQGLTPAMTTKTRA